MSKSKVAVRMLAAVVGVFGVRGALSAGVITQYSFTTTNAGPVNTLTATIGTGMATQLGMTNNYIYANGEGPGSIAAADIVATPGTANPTFSEDTWRIRGNSNNTNAGPNMANGWNNSAPNYTQGAEFGANTTGFIPTLLTFDWYSTTQGVGNLQVRYTLDGTTWTNLGTDLIATSNDYYHATATSTSPTNSFSLSGISGAANDPFFAVELVSVRPVSTDANYLGAGNTNYASAAGGNYNNNSGNWRFDNITISGAAVPLPPAAGMALLGLAALVILGQARRMKLE